MVKESPVVADKDAEAKDSSLQTKTVGLMLLDRFLSSNIGILTGQFCG